MEPNVILLLNPYKNLNANKWVDKKMNTFPIRCFDFWVQKTWQTGLMSSIATCDKPSQPLMHIEYHSSELQSPLFIHLSQHLPYYIGITWICFFLHKELPLFSSSSCKKEW